MMERGTDAGPDGLLADLSGPQREAVTHTDGPLLILAGPGSGKTRVVTRRAAYLAATVTEPWHILAVTFTNKAAREMQERIAALSVADGMTVSTFHALGAKLLRIHHDRAGVPRDFTIFDTDDRRKVIKKAIEACDLSTTNWQPAVVEREISFAKSEMLTAEAYAVEDRDWRQRAIARIYVAYDAMMAEMAGLDFDDLLMRVALLLGRDSELREQLEERYRYVLIDEYQDTNAAQYRIAQLLTRKRCNLCATGDPDQSIYGWRGADIGNILRFEEDFPRARVVRLEQNYRSTKRILSAADALIAGNMQRKAKTLWTENDDGPAVRVVEYETADEEAHSIAAELAVTARRGACLADTAIFYRVNSLSRAVEEALIRSGVPYQVARGVEFYRRKEIKDVLAYLRVLVNPADEVSLLRVINTPPRGIGATTVNRLVEAAGQAGRPVFELITGGSDLAALGRSATKVAQFGDLLRQLGGVLDQPASEAIDHIVSHSGLRAFYKPLTDAEGGPGRNIDELISAAADFERQQPEATVRGWLEHTALVSDVDAVKDAAGCVTLMTLHAAKGLEFENVFMIGLEDGLLPMRRRDEDEWQDDEEERRLCFVGITRAKRRLTLSRARYRSARGRAARSVRSPFLSELPRSEIEWVGGETPMSRRDDAESAEGGNGLPADIEQWEVGTLVRHPTHGLGRIMSMRRGANRTHVDVEFQRGLRSSWILEFADLVRVAFDEID